MVLALVRPLVFSHPRETLNDLLPRTSQSILNRTEESLLLSDDRPDLELIWELSVFGELVQAPGATLLVYRTTIRDVLQRCRTIRQRETSRLVALAIQRLFRSLVEVFVISSPPKDDRLPTRVSRSLSSIGEDRGGLFQTWGQAANVAELQVRFHLPSVEEIEFAGELLETFVEPELQLLKEKSSILSKDERRRSLKILRSVVDGAFRLFPSIVPLTSRYPIYYQHLPKQTFVMDLRPRLLREIGTVLDRLVSDRSDDILSINTALAVSADRRTIVDVLL